MHGFFFSKHNSKVLLGKFRRLLCFGFVGNNIGNEIQDYLST
jgi:hypothetical protein